MGNTIDPSPQASAAEPAPPYSDDQLKIFGRRSRDATHQVIWYLGALRQTGDPNFDLPILRAALWRIQQARGITDAAHGCLRESPDAPLEPEPPHDESPGRHDPVDPVRKSLKRWTHLRASLADLERLASSIAEASENSQEPSAEQQQEFFSELEFCLTDCQSYLRASLYLYRFVWLEHGVPTGLRWLRRHAATSLNLAGVAAVLAFVPQISSLFIEAAASTALFGLLLVAAALVPIVLGHHAAAHRQRALRYDIFGHSFRALSYQPKVPGRSIPRHRPGDPLVEVLRRSITRRITWMVVGLIAVAAVAGLGHVVAPGQLALTVFGSVALFYSTGIIAFALDYWAFIDPRPVRALFIAGFGATAMLMDNPSGVPITVGVLIFLTVLMLWLAVAAAKREDFANRNAYGLFAGIFFAALTLALSSTWNRHRELWRDPVGVPQVPRVPTDAWPRTQGDNNDPVVVLTASGGGSRAAIFTSLALEALHNDVPEVACDLQAIGSVSGGSLASAMYVKDRWFGQADVCARDQAYDYEERLSKAMAEDFIWPTIAGAIPLKSRGLTLQESWDEAPVHLGRRSIEDIALAWNANRRRAPLPLFHTTNLERHAVVMSPLEAKAFTDPRSRESASSHNAYAPLRSPTWVYYRDAIYGIEELLPRRPTKLSEAVRASANFPYGFPLVEVLPAGGLIYSPDPDRRRKLEDREDKGLRMMLTDGGTLSNSGIWGVYQLLRNRSETLSKRGVLLIIVEASLMPTYSRPGRLSGLAEVIRDQPPLGQSLHRALLDDLSARLGDRFAVVQIDLRATESDNVHTTWALPASRVQELKSLFVEAWTSGKVSKSQELRDKHTALRRAAQACSTAPDTLPCVLPASSAPSWLRPPTD